MEEEEEEGITVPSFPRPANSFQGSRTLSTGPNSKVIAPIPRLPREIANPSRNRGWARAILNHHTPNSRRLDDTQRLGDSGE